MKVKMYARLYILRVRKRPSNGLTLFGRTKHGHPHVFTRES